MGRARAGAEDLVVVIGAGVAGLTAARELSRCHRVLVLEARERLGGRTRTEIGVDGAVLETGAEFVHGGNPRFLAALRRYGIALRPVPQRHFLREGRRLLRTDDLWERVGRVMTVLGANSPAAKGASIGELWRRRILEVPPADAALARNFIEGFEAAPLGRMSAEAMGEIGAEEKQWRVPGGYARLAACLAADVLRRGGEIRCGHAVRAVRWRRGAVEVDGVSARALLVTVPLGLERALGFRPALPGRGRWRRLELGRVVRVSLVFRAELWESKALPPELRGADGRRFGFVHAAEDGAGAGAMPPAFPTWWARAPDPVLVGWVGGPRADRLAGCGERALREEALRSLAAVVGGTAGEWRRQLRGFATHDWSADPYARGAYSYARAGAENAPRELARPVADTIFFAGEATADVAELGTVHGAHASGLRAAAEIESALR